MPLTGLLCVCRPLLPACVCVCVLHKIAHKTLAVKRTQRTHNAAENMNNEPSFHFSCVCKTFN